jgi:hypothetical protein
MKQLVDRRGVKREGVEEGVKRAEGEGVESRGGEGKRRGRQGRQGRGAEVAGVAREHGVPVAA